MGTISLTIFRYGYCFLDNIQGRVLFPRQYLGTGTVFLTIFRYGYCFLDNVLSTCTISSTLLSKGLCFFEKHCTNINVKYFARSNSHLSVCTRHVYSSLGSQTNRTKQTDIQRNVNKSPIMVHICSSEVSWPLCCHCITIQDGRGYIILSWVLMILWCETF